jgi:gluconolactonase
MKKILSEYIVQSMKLMAVLAITGLIAAAYSVKESSSNQEATTESESSGVVEVLDEEVTNLIDPSATLEVLGEGYKWSEGPVWVE